MNIQLIYSICCRKRGALLLRLSPHGEGGAFSLLKAFLLPFAPCGGNFATFFSVWGGFFYNLKAFFAPFFPCRGFFATFVSLWELFSLFKSLSATFFSMWWPFCCGFFSLFEGPFATFFSFQGTFFTV